jgi:type I restriction enzyme S subunit
MKNSSEKVLLSTIAEVFNGKTPSNKEKRDKGHPVLKIKDISENGQFIGEFNSFVDDSFFNKYRYKRIRIGDTLILNAAHNSDYVGTKVCLADEDIVDALPTGEWLIIRSIKQSAYNRYIFYFMISPYGRYFIKNLVKGIHLYPGDVANIKIPLPPLDIQKKIAAVLDKADRLRQLRKQAMEKLDKLAESVFLDMFGDPVTNPKGWEIKYLSEFILFLTSGSRGWAKYYVDFGYKFIRVQNVKKGKLNFTDVQYVSPPDNKESIRTRVQTNDLLISITADLGRTAVVDKNTAKEGAFINQHLSLLRLNNKINPVFVSSFLESAGGIHQFKRLDQIGVKSGLNFNALRSLKIFYPPIDIQCKFTSLLEKIGNQKETMNRSLKKMDDNFNSLLKRAFKGELEFNDEFFDKLENENQEVI